jgi:menaquinone-dependent protoporphyrinogen IX oxidase
MNTAVIYKSRTGFTAVYAKWISEALGADLMKTDETDISKLPYYDTVIYGGGLYASGIGGIKLITKNMDVLSDKKIVVFGVGATPPRQKDIDYIIKSNFSDEQMKTIKFFYLRGGFDYERLSFLYKVIMTLFKLKLNFIKSKDPDAKGMLASYDNPIDFTKKKSIEPLVDYVTGE